MLKGFCHNIFSSVRENFIWRNLYNENIQLFSCRCYGFNRTDPNRAFQIRLFLLHYNEYLFIHIYHMHSDKPPHSLYWQINDIFVIERGRQTFRPKGIHSKLNFCQENKVCDWLWCGNGQMPKEQPSKCLAIYTYIYYCYTVMSALHMYNLFTIRIYSALVSIFIWHSIWHSSFWMSAIVAWSSPVCHKQIKSG